VKNRGASSIEPTVFSPVSSSPTHGSAENTAFAASSIRGRPIVVVIEEVAVDLVAILAAVAFIREPVDE
jgi:hypothetical protein